MKILIVIDMQNDFVTGSLGTDEAKAIVPSVINKIERYRYQYSKVVFTRDTHNEDYPDTLEGQKLPVVHCKFETNGWNFIPQIKIRKEDTVVNKLTFGYEDWDWLFKEIIDFDPDIDEIELCGLCTDICVISNALFLRTLYPNTKITVDAKCCAGVTPEKHLAALEVMKSCQIDVINE